MPIFIRAARIIHPLSPLHLQSVSIFIAQGRIEKIGKRISPTGRYHEINLPDLCVSPGWVDMHAYLPEPGEEQKETITNGLLAAASGGFTHVCVHPHSPAVAQTRADIEFLLKKAEGAVTSLLPIGAIVSEKDKNNLTELYDLHSGGAVAFSNGKQATPNLGLVERALLYVKAMNGLLLLHPEEKSIAKNGVMNEGLRSAQMGLPPLPALAEELSVAQLLYLLEHTGSRLHITDVSLKKSGELIKQAKKKNKQLTASVNAYSLLQNDNDLQDYNTLLKLNPPLRNPSDMTALRKLVAEGSIDTITSQHSPHEEDAKKLEFDKAAFGMIGLETCYAVANTALQKLADDTRLVELLSINARKILRLPMPIFAEGETADITLFEPNIKWTINDAHIVSKSKNTPYIGQQFIGRVVGVVHRHLSHFNYGYI